MNEHEDAVLFGRNMRLFRRARSLTQKELVIQAGIDRATGSLIENGREEPRADTVRKLAAVLGVTPADFWRDAAQFTTSVEPGRSSDELIYQTPDETRLHPGLQELLDDDRTRLMLGLTPEEEQMLASIRTRRDAPLGKDFFIDVLISYRRHKEK